MLVNILEAFENTTLITSGPQPVLRPVFDSPGMVGPLRDTPDPRLQLESSLSNHMANGTLLLIGRRILWVVPNMKFVIERST